MDHLGASIGPMLALGLVSLVGQHPDRHSDLGRSPAARRHRCRQAAVRSACAGAGSHHWLGPPLGCARPGRRPRPRDRSDPGEINCPSARDQPDHAQADGQKAADALVTDRSLALHPGSAPLSSTMTWPAASAAGIRASPTLAAWPRSRSRSPHSAPETTGALGQLISPGSERSPRPVSPHQQSPPGL